MSYAVLIVDTAVPEGSVTSWTMASRDLGFVHPSDLDLAASWLTERESSEVLVLARPRHSRAAHTVATTVAGAIPTLAAHVALRESTVLAMAVAASQSLELDTDAPLAYSAALDALDRSIAGARLRRLTRVDSPNPSAWQHITSLFGRPHIALRGTPGRVVRVDAPVDLPEDATLLIAAEEGSPEFTEVVEALSPPGPAHTVPPVISTSDSFGAMGTEFVVFTPAETAQGTWRCRVCDQSLDQTECPFCRVRSTYQEPVA